MLAAAFSPRDIYRMSRAIIEQELVLAERQAVEGRFEIKSQLATIDELARRGHDTAAAWATLVSLHEEQAIYDKTVERLIAELRRYDSKQAT
jgi:hypothetical protein